MLSEHYYDLRLAVRGTDTEDFVTRINMADLGALTVGDLSFGTEIRTGYCQPGFYHVCVPLEGGFGVQEGSALPAYTTPARLCSTTRPGTSASTTGRPTAVSSR
ncbi:hypothetical protein NKH77_50380 [Streptomyces sp. M19]